MELKDLVALKSRFISREVNHELVLVPITGNIARMNEMFTLNETAKFIWERTQQGTTNEVLIKLMTDEFEIDGETAERDIFGFLEKIEVLMNK